VQFVLKGFKDFIMRGNVIQLAVAVVIGAAFNDVVKTFADAFVKPLIQLIAGGNTLSGVWKVEDVKFEWSSFLNAAIGFLITAAVVYFVFVLPMNKLAERRARGREPEPDKVSDEVRLLTEIRDALTSRTDPPR
jgi:large conductance mechanosensitive channel